MHQGSCLCQSIRYEVDGELGDFGYCHCRSCRKASGSAHAANSPVERAKFRLLSGADTLREYESSPGKFRAFCSQCGSHIVAEREGKGTILLRMGCLDTPTTQRPKVHIWRSEGASWFNPKDQLPEWHEGTPPPA